MSAASPTVARRRPAAASPARSRSAIDASVVHGLLALVTLGLVAFGLVMVFSASSARAAISADDPAYYLKRQGIYAALGLVALVVLSRTGLAALRRSAGTVLAACLALLALVLVVGETVNGARRWIELGPITMQPSELAKIALALWVSAFLARKPAPATLGALLRPIGLVTGIAAMLVLAEPDLGTAIAFGIVVGTALLVSGTPLRVMATAGAITAGLVLLVSWVTPYRRARLLSFLDPWADAGDTGWQSVQALLALGSGGLFGVGLGESVQKVYYLPEASTDMIFAIVGEELGLLGTVSVVLAFVALGYCGLRIALACRDPFGKRLAACLTALLCGQAALNIGAVLGLAPVTGVPLPFISYGGSSLIVSLAAVGILLNIALNNGSSGGKAAVRDRGGRNSGPRPARPRGRGGAAGPGRRSHVRRPAAT
jgi:cell division protein FtsW